MTEPTPARPGRRTVLVPDLDGELLAPLRALEEILLSLSLWEDDDREDPPTDREPVALPAPLADGVALGAVQRLAGALRRTQSIGAERGRLLGPDGSYEHARLTVLELSGEDVAILSATAAALGHPLLDPDVADVVQTYAETYRRVDRTELVSLVARLAGLLDLEATADSRLLVERLSANPPGLDLALTDEEELAYVRTADRLNHMWALGSGIDRYLY
jgi:hypothetical protein